MKSIHVLLMATLLATATAVSAQTPPGYSSPLPANSFNADIIKAFSSSVPSANQPSAQTQVDQESDCPFAKAMQEANVAWQKLRALCGSVKSSGCNEGACGKANACNGTGCATGVAGCAKGVAVAQAPKSCCCAKECACCETCKGVKAQGTVQYGQMPIPMGCPINSLPSTTAGWNVQAGPAAVQIVAQTPAGPSFAYMMPVNLSARPTKLVTPDFEAHCDQMIHKGDTIQLIGNVMLLCKKHAQPIRVEGQRIVINLNDGSFVVENGPALPRPSSSTVGFGVMRMSIGECGMVRPAGNLNTTPCAPPTSECPRTHFAPATGVIEVVPVPPAPVTGPRPR